MPGDRDGRPRGLGAGRRGDRAISASYDWVVLTSTNGVDRFLHRFRERSRRLRRRSPSACVAAVGSATAAPHARRGGVPPDLVPDGLPRRGARRRVRRARRRASAAASSSRVPRRRARSCPDALRRDGLRRRRRDRVPHGRRPSPTRRCVERLRAGTVDVGHLHESGAIAQRFLDADRVRRGSTPARCCASWSIASDRAGHDRRRSSSSGYEVDVEAARVDDGRARSRRSSPRRGCRSRRASSGRGAARASH